MDIKDRLEKFAIRDYKQEYFLRSIILAIGENQDLKDCLVTDAGKISLYHALQRAAATGLSLNPLEGKAALIPYAGKIVYQVMKQGMIELLMDTGMIEYISADLVRENDKFSIKKSFSGDEYSYEPSLTKRGEIIGFYAACKIKDGQTHVAYMSNEEMLEHKDRYSSSKGMKDKSPWEKHYPGMGVKTVIKKLLRNINLPPVVAAAMNDTDTYEIEETEMIDKSGYSADDVKKELKEKTVIDDKKDDPEVAVDKISSDLF